MRPENRIRSAFTCISAEEELKASTKEFLQSRRRRDEVKAGYGRRIFGIACAALAVICMVSFYHMLYVPVSYVSIDVNPSMELELNRFDRVISARAYNKDGEKILKDVALGGKYYTDAIALLMESNAMQPYLAGDGDLVFTVASGDGSRKKELIRGIQSSPGCAGHGGRSMEADIGLVREAHENELSVGKYAAYKILQQYDSSVSASDCHNMSMSEIHEMIREHERHGNCGSGQEDNDAHSGHGNGEGNGNGHESHGNGHKESNAHGGGSHK